eukprot:TRINITY_DN1305_c0_g1_i1.p2 TRINITY_DN1305_c0_g1~~TRINITY_DN1305_c0_g1_i1.p2  ORF type:complete len:236 (+),score=65.96 TRINITY_DN1305_c0_g1_i1:201-908(+)
MHRHTPKQIFLSPEEHPVVIDLNSLGLTSPGMGKPKKMFKLEQVEVETMEGSVSTASHPNRVWKRRGSGEGGQGGGGWKRTHAVVGGFVGGLLMVLAVLLMTKPPSHDLAVKNRQLQKEKQETDEENKALKTIVEEASKQRLNTSSLIHRLNDLEARINKPQETEPPDILRPGSLITAAHDFLIGTKTIIALGSPGIIISRDANTTKWVVQFTGTFGPSRPVRLLATSRDIIKVQ